MAEWLKEFTQLLAHCRIIGFVHCNQNPRKELQQVQKLREIRKQYVYNIYIYGSSLFQKVVLLTDSQNTCVRGPWAGHILKKQT